MRVNQADALLEDIALWGELKPMLTADALIGHALADCGWAVAKGLLVISADVDVCALWMQLHCDATDDPLSHSVETLALEALSQKPN